MKIKELALLIEGIIEGDDNTEITGLSGIESARQGHLTFAIDQEKLQSAELSQSSCVLTTRNSRKSSKPLIRVNNPKLAFLMAYNYLQKQVISDTFIHPSAVIDPTVVLGKGVYVGPLVAIGKNVVIGDYTHIDAGVVIGDNCKIGACCQIYARVVLYADAVLKDRVILHSGVVVGSDGFGYMRQADKIYKFPQLGTVIIEDDVEIGANSTIDRGSLGCTRIGAGSKIDNLCHIAHNVTIGKNVIMAAQCGIAGSTVIGDNVTMSGQVAVIDNVTIGANARIGGQSGIIGHIKENDVIWGSPARGISQIKRQLAVLSWLTKNFTKISEIINKKD